MLLCITKFLNYVIIKYIFCFHPYTNVNQPNLGIASTICTCYCNTIINIINSDSCECQLLSITHDIYASFDWNSGEDLDVCVFSIKVSQMDFLFTYIS